MMMVQEKYSLVVPVLTMEGNASLGRLLESLKRQTLPPEEVHIVAGDRRQGRAINYGVNRVKTKYVGTVDDDTGIDDPGLYMKLISAMEKDPSIGIGGAACPVPDHASNFQKRAMREIPRRFFPVQSLHRDSDMVQHPCLVMPVSLFREIGGEDEQLVRGLDPILRQKVRDHNRRVVVIANTWVYHMLPADFRTVLRMYYRNGRGSAFAGRFYPERIVELTDGMKGGAFIKKRSLLYRIFRRAAGLPAAFYSCRFIKLSTDIAYMLGVVKGKTDPFSCGDPPGIQQVTTEKKQLSSFALYIHRVVLEKHTKG